MLAFSDLQADLGAELVRRGIAVVTFNQRTVAEILQMIRMLGGLVGCQVDAERLASALEADLDRIRTSAARFRRGCACSSRNGTSRSSRAFAGWRSSSRSPAATPIFPELKNAALGKDRIVEAAEVARRNPDVVFASWCGKKVKRSTISGRPGGMSSPPSGKTGIFEVKSTYILQPGPASLTEGVRQLHSCLARVHNVDVDPALAPQERVPNRLPA